MNLKVLVARPAAQREQWAHIKAALLKNKDTLYEADDQEEAFAKAREGGWDAIISTLELARSSASPAPERRGGLELLSRLEQQPMQLLYDKAVNFGLVLDAEDPEVVSQSRFLQFRPEIFVNNTLEARLVGFLRDLGPRMRCLDIIIIARPGRRWRYRMVGEGFRYERDGFVRIEAAQTTIWHQLSQSIQSGKENWKSSFDMLGGNLIDTFCHFSKSFAGDLKSGLEVAGNDLANTRVSFAISTELYPIVMESLFAPEPRQPWLAEAPLIRTLKPKPPNLAVLLKQGAGFVRTLILCANVEGRVQELQLPTGAAMRFEKLPNAELECRLVHRQLDNARKQGLPLFPPEVVGIDQPLTRARLIAELSKPWDIIHFVGHAHYQKKGDDVGQGYLIVDHDEPGRLDAVEIKSIPALAKSKLVYLSSCHGGSARFAQVAAKHNVPVLIGFNAKVPDGYALRFASTFYRRVLKRHTIDESFLHARRSLYRRIPHDNTWASVVLVSS